MADIEKDEAPQTAEEESQQANNETAPEGAVEDNKDAASADGKEPSADEKGADQFVTPQVLQGVIAAQQRTQKEDLGKTIEGLEGKIEQLTSSIESTAQIATERSRLRRKRRAY